MQIVMPKKAEVQVKLKIVIFILFVSVTLGLSVAFPIYMDYQKTVSDDPMVWEGDIQEFRNSDRASGIPDHPIVFVGSSSIRLWENLKGTISNRPVLNRGFGGARIADIEYYLEDLVLKYNPDMVVLYVGVIDLALEKGEIKDSVFESLYTLSKSIREELPSAKIAIVALRPSPYRKETFSEYARFNRNIKRVSEKDSHIYYIDANGSVVDESGALRKDIYSFDRQHLNEIGYSLWGSEIEGSISEILKEL